MPNKYKRSWIPSWPWLLLLLTNLAPAVVSAQPTAIQAAATPVIEEIRIRGNRRITFEDIIFYIQTRKGDPYDEARLRLDWQAVNKTNIFEQIDLISEDGVSGKIVTFQVKEKPMIRSIKYQGNKSFTESDILEHFKERKVGLTVDSQFDPGRIKAAERALKELLEKNGRPLGKIKMEREDVALAGVNVRFVITEGEKVRVGRLTFSGNKVYGDEKIASYMKLVQERDFINVFRGRDKYARMMLEADLEQNAKKVYQESGYVRANFGEPTVHIKEGPQGIIPLFKKTKRQFFIDIPVEAGPQFKVGEIKAENAEIKQGERVVINNAGAVAFFGMRSGDVVNFTKLRNGLEQLKKFYHSYGYINAEILPNQNVDEEKKLYNMTFNITPGAQFTVNQINFQGNTKTRDLVLRREFLLIEKSPYSGYLMDLSVLRLNQLGFFDKIEEKDYDITPNEDTKEVDVTLRVKEKSQQSIGVTGGVSGYSGSFIGMNYSTNNFLGRGERIDVDITGGTRTSNFMVSFTEPYVFSSRWSLGLSVFNQRYRYDTYGMLGVYWGNIKDSLQLFTRTSTGITLSASYPLSNFWRFGGSYSIQSIGISDIAEDYEDYALSQMIGFTPGGDTSKVKTKGIIRSEITPTLTYNNTNDYYNPSKGHNITLSFGLTGGVMGGDYNMIRPSLEYRYFKADKWISGGKNVFAFRILGGYLGGFRGTPVPFWDRFYIGGENTIRGFDIRSIYPLTISRTLSYDENRVPIVDPDTGMPSTSFSPGWSGGDIYYVGNIEYRMPIAGPLSISPFFDFGVTKTLRRKDLVFGDTDTITKLLDEPNQVMRSSTGVELQFILPVVQAPFRLIFAYNPNRLTRKDELYPYVEPKKDIKFTIGRSF